MSGQLPNFIEKGVMSTTTIVIICVVIAHFVIGIGLVRHAHHKGWFTR